MANYRSVAQGATGQFEGHGTTRGKARDMALKRFLRAHKAKRGELWPASFYEYVRRPDGRWDLLGSVPGDPAWRM